MKKFFLVLCSALIPLIIFAQPKVTKERIEVQIASAIGKQVEASKESRTPIERKMSSQLLELRAQHKAFGGTFQPKGITTQSVGTKSVAQVDLNERVHLYLNIPKNEPVAAFVKKLESNGIIISASNNSIPVIQVWATIPELDGIAVMPEVQTIDLVIPPDLNTGPVLSEGVARVHSDVAQTVMGANGAGIKVGVMSDDCGTTEGLVAPRVANGELTFNPVIIDDSKTVASGRTHEGLAMMEIVQDVAPQAQLYFATASTGEVQFANNIGALATNGCKVITDDVIYFDEPVFEDGSVAQEVNTVTTNNGVIYTSAAANQAQNSYFGTYSPLANQPVGSSGNLNVHNNGGGQYGIPLLIGANKTAQVTLHWDDQYGTSGNDYDLYLVNAANNLTLASSTNVQNGAGKPWEFLIYTNPNGATIQTYIIAVRKAVSVADPNGTARIKITAYGNTQINGVGTAVSSTFGHSAATGCLSAGAINQGGNNYNTIENFSNQGPVYMIDFTVGGGAGGARPVLSTRTKPDVASIDGVSTSVGGFAPFFGTSAATPHVGGVAAQLASLYPSITPAAAQTAIRNGCINYGAAGMNNVFGAGRTDAFRTIALYRQSISPGTYTANFTTPGATITDNSAAGITSTLSLSPTVASPTPSLIYVSVTVDGHNKIGDLKYTLKSPDNTTITLMNRPVSGAGNATGINPNTIFGDAASSSIQTANPAGLEELGFYIPANAISTAGGFGSHGLGGTWTLTASDNAAGNVGTLRDWGIYAVEAVSGPVSAMTKTTFAGTFTSISGDAGVTTVGTGGDEAVHPLTLPFNFTDDGTLFTSGASVSMSDNGFLVLGPYGGSAANDQNRWGVTYNVNYSLMPFGMDLDEFAAGGAMYYEVTGTTPNRVATYEWHNFDIWPQTSNPTNMQVKLYETTNVIEFLYSNPGWTFEGGTFPVYGSDPDMGAVGLTGNPAECDNKYYNESTAILPASNIRFTPVAAASSITITAPVGGETWGAGSTQNITWTSNGIVNVKIEYSTNSGGSWTTITASTAAAGGTYAWAIPGGQAQGNTYIIRVSDASSGSPNCWSPSTFSITGCFPTAVISLSPAILTIPNQTLQTITATVTISGGCAPSFKLLSVTSSDPDAGTFPGDIPGDIVAVTGTAATTFQVRAETKPYGNGRFYTATYRIFEGANPVGDYPAKVAVLESGGFVPPNSPGTCGLQLATAIPDFTGPTLTIPYNLTSPGIATLSVYSLQGKERSRLLNNASLPAGAGSVNWNGTSTYGLNPGTNLPNGTYVLVFKGCNGSDSRVFTINH